jgi:hypothetical protein
VAYCDSENVELFVVRVDVSEQGVEVAIDSGTVM